MGKYYKKKDTPLNFLSSSCFSTLDFNNDVMIMGNNSYDKIQEIILQKTLINDKIP